MNIHRPISGKILVGHQGLGVPDTEILQQRAFEIARIQEREIPNSDDWEAAQREVHGHRLDPNSMESEILPSELAPGPVERVSGHLEMEDDINVVEELIREGMEEAEHERMLLAHTREPEEEQGFEE
jgi:hypothetical protein